FAYSDPLSYTHQFRFVFVCVSSREANYTHRPNTRQLPHNTFLTPKPSPINNSLIYNESARQNN
ncbi:hypothetical protein ACUHMQ_02790, partial [Chitinimonas sp. PSY-7]|uniref:hypothetical protein n=1 Tax=Chitinimonas sp. PSY-7 TaxID=3459088 RepID=UPI0040400583